jgi:membrane protein DedA with SNARE-associated domain
MDFTLLETWGYLALAFFSFGGSFVVVAAAGVLSATGHMNLAVVLVVASFFNFLGDNFLFYLARYHRKEVLPYFAKHRRKLAYASVIMRRYGVWAVFIQKFLYGVKTLVPLVMGMGKFPFAKFVFFNAFASVLFVGVIGLSAYFAGDTVMALFEVVKSHPWIPPLTLASIIGTVWFVVSFYADKTKR